MQTQMQYIIMRLHNQVGSTTSLDNSHLIEVNEDETGASSVTNYEYERREQDKKSLIKVLKPEYISEFIEEFKKSDRRLKGVN